MGIFDLPEGYAEIKRVDLMKDKRTAVLVNISALLIAVLVFIIGIIFVPLNLKIDSDELIFLALKMLGVSAGMFVYIFVHELIHGAFFKLYSGRKANTGLRAYMLTRGATLIITSVSI